MSFVARFLIVGTILKLEVANLYGQEIHMKRGCRLNVLVMITVTVWAGSDFSNAIQ